MCTAVLEPPGCQTGTRASPHPRPGPGHDTRRPEMRAHTSTSMTRPAWSRVLLIVLGVCALAVPASASAAQSSTSADTVRDWNLYATNALGNPPTAPVMPGVGQPPQVSVLHVGMVQGAVYDAGNAIDGGHEPYLGAPAADPTDSKAAAAAAAAHSVLVG